MADALSKGRQTAEARQALVTGRDILVTLTAKYPDGAQWKQNLSWFDAQRGEKAALDLPKSQMIGFGSARHVVAGSMTRQASVTGLTASSPPTVTR
jgi:hypothetical protein